MTSEDSGRFDRVLLEAALPAAEPPPGFADRVLAAAHQRDVKPTRVGRWVALSAVVAVAATVLVFFGLEHFAFPALGGSGEMEAAGREEVRLGGRGVAVAEPGSALGWHVDRRGAARIEQKRGNVFYRVERGGPFVVTTEAGEIEVKGTCFRVEVEPMSWKHGFLGAAGGATLATVIVTVYEGHVAVRNAHGATEVTAGGRVGLTAESPPSAALAVAGDAKAAAVLAGAPPDTATRDDLLTRDAVHRQQISALESQVKELARLRVTPGKPDEGKREGRRITKFSNFTKDELLDMAKNCEVRGDLPAFGEDGESIDRGGSSQLGLSPQDLATYKGVLAAEQQKYAAAVHALYQEVTGEHGDNLEVQTLITELQGKLGRNNMYEARVRLSQERAGLAPPLDPAQQPPGYRLLSLLMGEGDVVEQAVAQQLGPDKARTLREHGSHGSMAMSGCKDR